MTRANPAWTQMTEAEWLEGSDLDRMLTDLGRSDFADPRKLRLFACACCRRIWQALSERDRQRVEVAERYADDLSSIDEIKEAVGFPESYEMSEWRKKTGITFGDPPPGEGPFLPWQSSYHAGYAVGLALSLPRDWDLPPVHQTKSHYDWSKAGVSADQAIIAAFYHRLRERGVAIDREVPQEEIDWDEEATVRSEETASQLRIFRDIFGNPFRPPCLDEAWRTATVIAQTQDLYTEARFEDAPLLADALEDAGCRNADVVSHLRGTVTHVRGCWVLDLILENGGPRSRGRGRYSDHVAPRPN